MCSVLLVALCCSVLLVALCCLASPFIKKWNAQELEHSQSQPSRQSINHSGSHHCEMHPIFPSVTIHLSILNTQNGGRSNVETMFAAWTSSNSAEAWKSAWQQLLLKHPWLFKKTISKIELTLLACGISWSHQTEWFKIVCVPQWQVSRFATLFC